MNLNSYSRQEDFVEADYRKECISKKLSIISPFFKKPSTKWRDRALYFGVILANTTAGAALVFACLIYGQLNALRDNSAITKPINNSFEWMQQPETTTPKGVIKRCNRTGITREELKHALSLAKENNSALYDNISSLNRTIRRIDNAIRRGYMESDDGWVTPFNGYQYKLTTNKQSWNDSRNECKNSGGDLATHGAQDWGTRRKLLRAFNSSDDVAIGLSDQGNNGTWKWVNGPGSRVATKEVGLWKKGEPDDGSQYCGKLGRDIYAENYECDEGTLAMCERPLMT